MEFPLPKATVTGRIDVLIRGNSIEIGTIRPLKTALHDDIHSGADVRPRVEHDRKTSPKSVAYLDDASLKEVEVSDHHLANAKR